MKKLHFWDRILLFLCALTALVCGAYLLYANFAQLPWAFAQKIQSASLYTPNALVLVCVGLLSVLLSIFLFLLSKRLFERRKDFVVQKIENGELRIAMKAIENLVQKCIDMHDEIKVLSMQIHNTRKGVTIDLHISLANNISIPLAVASLQKQIKQYLLASSGIDVQEVRVSVETAKSAAGDSPYLVPADSHTAAEKQPEPKENKKRATHQRIFSRAEQAATLPEAPKAEESVPAAEPVKEEAPAPEPEKEETPAPAAEAEEAPQEEANISQEIETEAEAASPDIPAEPQEADTSEENQEELKEEEANE